MNLYIIKCIIFSFFFIVKIINCNNDCWTSFDAEKHFDIMDELDNRYAHQKQNYQRKIGGSMFDNKMLTIMVKNHGKSVRNIHAAQREHSTIPAGINLGGYCMMKMPKSLLFFHRMKLRNSTTFRITRLTNNLDELTMEADILLNDLHLFGSYDFTTILSKPGVLSYDPTYGQIELLLKNVKYKMEGRYRLLKNRLIIEMISSEADLDNVLVAYPNKNSTYSFEMQKKNIEVFMDRLKVDLDKWLKDYFNDFLMYHVVAEDAEFEKYNEEKTTKLNEYADSVIDKVLQLLNKMKASAVQLPPFEIHTMSVAEITLRDGVLRGLDSIYRRSITTGTKKNNIRKVDTIVGFSNLKLSYRYDTKLKSGLPPVTGVLTLTADDLTAHMGLTLTKDPETADLSFTFLEQAKPESLTIEGPANRMISNFKYLLERHIIAIMTNTLVHSIKMLGTLDRCVPLLFAYNDIDPYKKQTSQEFRETKLEDNKESNDESVKEILNEENNNDEEVEDKETLSNVTLENFKDVTTLINGVESIQADSQGLQNEEKENLSYNNDVTEADQVFLQELHNDSQENNQNNEIDVSTHKPSIDKNVSENENESVKRRKSFIIRTKKPRYRSKKL